MVRKLGGNGSDDGEETKKDKIKMKKIVKRKRSGKIDGGNEEK